MAKTFKNLLVPENIVWEENSQEDAISNFVENGCGCITCNCAGIHCDRCIFDKIHMTETIEFIKSRFKSAKCNIEEDDLLL